MSISEIEEIPAPVRKKFQLNPPADDAAIASCEAQLQTDLPADYAQFLRFADGGEGVMGETYVILWRIEGLKEANEGCKVQEFIPGLMLIRSNGGGEAFGFDQRSHPWRYVMVPFIVMLWEDAILGQQRVKG